MAAKAAPLPGCEYPSGELDRWPGAADSQVSVSSPDRLRSRARDLLLIPRVDPLASPHFVTPKLNLFCFIYFFNLLGKKSIDYLGEREMIVSESRNEYDKGALSGSKKIKIKTSSEGKKSLKTPT